MLTCLGAARIFNHSRRAIGNVTYLHRKAKCINKYGIREESAMALYRISLSFCLIFLAANCTLAQCTSGGPGQGSLRLIGRVTNAQSDIEVSGVIVNLQGRKERRRVSTDNRGRFEFLCLESDIYTVETRRDGYAPTRVQFALLDSSIPDAVIRIEQLRTITTEPAGHILSVRQRLISQKARAAFQKGVKQLHRKKQPERSLSHLHKAIELYPDYDEAYVQLAVAFSRLLQMEDAERTLQEAIKVYPQNDRAYAFLGKVYQQQGSDQEALAALRQAIEIDSQLWLAHLDLGRILAEQGKFEDAYRHASLAHQLTADVPDVHLVFYNACINSQKYTAALAEIDEYVRLYPNSDVAKKMLVVRKQLSRKVADKAE